MTPLGRLIPASLIAVGLLSACSGDMSQLFSQNPLTTAALSPPQQAAAPAPIVSPTCVALNSRIDSLRREGVADRAAQAASGKTATVQVKRSSLAKLDELDRANAEFQAKCSALGPRTASVNSAPFATAGSVPVPLTPPAISPTASATVATAPAPRRVQEPARTGLEIEN